MRHGVDIKADSAPPVKALADGSGADDVLILHDGTVHSVAHLAPGMTLTCPSEELKRDIVIRVAFKNHCYTENYDPEKHKPEEILIKEGADRHRVFCPIRYALSHKLPEILSTLPGRRVNQTAVVRNYIFVVPLDVEGKVYEIFFMLQRAPKEDGADLRLTVESAYPNGGLNLRRRPRTIRFMILAHKVLTNQAVRFAAR